MLNDMYTLSNSVFYSAQMYIFLQQYKDLLFI